MEQLRVRHDIYSEFFRVPPSQSRVGVGNDFKCLNALFSHSEVAEGFGGSCSFNATSRYKPKNNEKIKAVELFEESST